MKRNRVIESILISIVIFGMILVGILKNGLTEILYDPIKTPEDWCIHEPCISLGNYIINQPSSTVMVFFLFLLTVWVGIRFILTQQEQESRLWWGLSLILMGIGAGLAGVSYQAFGYELKCRGYEYCLWTSWWEIAYMICTVAGSGAAYIGIACATLPKGAQTFWKNYAIVTSSIYVLIVSIGTFIANQFLLSFEFMILFSFIGGFALFIQNTRHYLQERQGIFPSVIKVWIMLVVVILVYFIALFSGFASDLWVQGIWFNENDVLHIMMIIWIVYIYVVFKNTLKDN